MRIRKMTPLALAITGIATPDSGMARAVYRSVEAIGWMFIVVGGLLVLLTITTLSVYKPWGRIGSVGEARARRVTAT